MREPRIIPVGDQAVLVEFEERIDAAVNERAIALAQTISREQVPGVRDVVPAYRSVMVHIDPRHVDYEALVGLARRAARAPADSRASRAPIRVPVCYDLEFGLDLTSVAEHCGLSPQEVVAIHAGRAYRVFMLGFTPGFPYMGTLDERIAMPRLDEPRLRVPAGSVGLAGTQTGIYPITGPGGWRIIGRTPLKPFDLQRPVPFAFEAGDLAEFYPVGRNEYERLSA